MTITEDPETRGVGRLFIDATSYSQVHRICAGDVPQAPAIAPIWDEAAPLLIITSTTVATVL